MSFNLISTFLIAVALAMDAFSVSMTKGFTQKNLKDLQIIYYALFFGIFQALMPILGYFCGNFIASIVESVAPIVGFALLLVIGVNMIRESFDGEEVSDEFSFKEVFILAIATSIDAFAVGITIALINDPILISSAIIGLVAFIFTIIGVIIGRKLGRFIGGNKFMILGGIILILIGFKILLGF